MCYDVLRYVPVCGCVGCLLLVGLLSLALALTSLARLGLPGRVRLLRLATCCTVKEEGC